ncbi:DMT family transporter [Frischella perrara]|uniref:DMT family transporter n=1 Tax=Frischella perrara TaxID=1267021 RepID=UPI0023F2CC4D|nr:DMT family transporter [Frischella perrara]
MKKAWIAEILLVGVAAGWGLGFPVMKIAVDETPVLTVLWLRFMLSALLLLPFCFGSLKKISFKTFFTGCLLGILLGTSFIFLITGLQMTTASNTGFLAGLAVIWVLLLSAPLSGKLPSIEAVLATVFGLMGLIVMSDFSSTQIQWGEILVVIGSLFSALHIVVLDKVTNQHNNSVLTFIEIATIAILIFIIQAINTPNNLLPNNWSNSLITALIITSVFSTVLAFWIQTAYQRYTTPTRAVLIYNLEPVFSALFAVWLLNETLSSDVFVGGGLILIGMCFPSLFTLFKKRKMVSDLSH